MFARRQESERRVPPPVTYNWQPSGAQHPLPDTPDMAGPDIICPDNSTLLVCFTIPETIRDILRRAMTHTTFEDICFVYYPRDEVPVWFLQAQDIEPALMGVIYTFEKADIEAHTRRMRGIAHSIAAGNCLESEHGALRAEGPSRTWYHKMVRNTSLLFVQSLQCAIFLMKSI
jgi:hypothetical protein